MSTFEAHEADDGARERGGGWTEEDEEDEEVVKIMTDMRDRMTLETRRDPVGTDYYERVRAFVSGLNEHVATDSGEPGLVVVGGSAFRHHLGDTCDGVPAAIADEDGAMLPDKIGCYTNDFDVQMTKRTWASRGVEAYVRKKNGGLFRDGRVAEVSGDVLMLYKRHSGTGQGLDVRLVDVLPPSVRGADGFHYATTEWLCDDMKRTVDDAALEFKASRRRFREEKVCTYL